MEKDYWRSYYFENKVKEKWEEMGFSVFKVTNDVIDLIALSEDNKQALVCKNKRELEEEEIKRIKELEKRIPIKVAIRRINDKRQLEITYWDPSL